MVFATKEMQKAMKARAKRKFDANPQKYIRRYWLLMGVMIAFLVILVFLSF